MVPVFRNLLAGLGGLAIASLCHAQDKEQSKSPKKEQLVKVASLGATTRAPSKAEADELGLKFEVRVQGQVVAKVEKNGAVAKAGIGIGDVLVKLGAVDLYSQDDIADVLSVNKPGATVKAVVLRAKSKKKETVAFALGAQETKSPKEPRLEWEFASLGEMDQALAKAKKENRNVLVGLSGAET